MHDLHSTTNVQTVLGRLPTGMEPLQPSTKPQTTFTHRPAQQHSTSTFSQPPNITTTRTLNANYSNISMKTRNQERISLGETQLPQHQKVPALQNDEPSGPPTPWQRSTTLLRLPQPHKFANSRSTQSCRTDGCNKKHHTPTTRQLQRKLCNRKQ